METARRPAAHATVRGGRRIVSYLVVPPESRDPLDPNAKQAVCVAYVTLKFAHRSGQADGLQCAVAVQPQRAVRVHGLQRIPVVVATTSFGVRRLRGSCRHPALDSAWGIQKVAEGWNAAIEVDDADYVCTSQHEQLLAQ